MVEIDGLLTIVGGDESIVEISPELLNNIVATTEQIRNKIISL
jgi:hypothetical protein